MEEIAMGKNENKVTEIEMIKKIKSLEAKLEKALYYGKLNLIIIEWVRKNYGKEVANKMKSEINAHIFNDPNNP